MQNICDTACLAGAYEWQMCSFCMFDHEKNSTERSPLKKITPSLCEEFRDRQFRRFARYYLQLMSSVSSCTKTNKTLRSARGEETPEEKEWMLKLNLEECTIAFCESYQAIH